MKLARLLISVAFNFLSAFSASAQTVPYVKTVSPGTGTGDSWANDSSDIQDMVYASSAGDEIWIAGAPIIRQKRRMVPSYVFEVRQELNHEVVLN